MRNGSAPPLANPARDRAEFARLPATCRPEDTARRRWGWGPEPMQFIGRFFRFIARLLGAVLLLAMLAVLLMDMVASMHQGTLRLASAGEVWAAVNRESLLLAEPGVDRHIWPGLWQAVVVPVLLWPAAAVLGVPAALLLLLLSSRRRRRRGGLR